MRSVGYGDGNGIGIVVWRVVRAGDGGVNRVGVVVPVPLPATVLSDVLPQTVPEGPGVELSW